VITSCISRVKASSAPQTEVIPDSMRTHFNGGSAVGASGAGVVIEGGKPIFLPIDRTPIFNARLFT
jgi:hypothetical protein